MSEQATAAATTTDTAAVDATTTTATTTDTTAAGATTTDTTATATEAGKADGATDTGKTEAAKEGDQAAQGAPEKYELQAPEGFQLEPDTTTAFEGIARELNLTNEQANKLVPLGAQLVQKVQAQQQEAHQQQVTQWADEAKSDKEFGGEKFDASLKVALKARDQFATPELRTVLDQTGLGNHPEVVRLFYRIGNAIGDDKFVNGQSAGGSAGKTLAERMYSHASK
jgi:hypothetical protein